jgi:hypothetical protein
MKRSMILMWMILISSVVFGNEEQTNQAKNSVEQDSSRSHRFQNNDFAQDTILDKSLKSIGGYGSVYFSGSPINGQWGVLSGTEWGLIINHSFIIGGSGHSLISPLNYPDQLNGTNMQITTQWGGLMLGYIFMPENLIHPFVKTMIGVGHLKLRETDWAYFVTELKVGADLNVTKWMRVGPYAAYRYVYGNINQLGIDDSKMNGLEAGIDLSFGLF